MVIKDLEDLEKVSASAGEKARWKKLFESEATINVEIEALKIGEKRIRQMLHTAEEEFGALNKKWAEKLMDLVTGKDQDTLAPLALLEPKIKGYHKKKAKVLLEHQARAKELQELIQDYKEALKIIQKKLEGGFTEVLRQANFARTIIYRRRAKTEEKRSESH